MTRASSIRRAAGAIALALGASTAIAREAPQVLEAGVADRGPLSKSLRLTPIDLRSPTGFERVYVGTGRTPGGGAMLERRDGALRAQFARSVYEPSRYGEVAVIPAGTVFQIGEPVSWQRAPGQAADATLSARVPAGASATGVALSPAAAPVARSARITIGHAEPEPEARVEHRSRRVALLVAQAAGGR